ncbi:MAG: hypothetical protein GVX78_02620, partial [Bacteroidetes bacterium]|nr:hypothetical protein [Bacteroidota bacterium]
MKNVIPSVKLSFICCSFLLPSICFAQGGSGFSMGSYGLIAAAVIVVLGAVVVVSENLLKVEAKRSGVDLNAKEKSSGSGLKRLFKGSLPDYLSGQHLIELSKGYDIPLKGKPQIPKKIETVHTKRYALQPPNF